MRNLAWGHKVIYRAGRFIQFPFSDDNLWPLFTNEIISTCMNSFYKHASLPCSQRPSDWPCIFGRLISAHEITIVCLYHWFIPWVVRCHWATLKVSPLHRKPFIWEFSHGTDLVSHASIKNYAPCNNLFITMIVITCSSACKQQGLRGGHQSSFDPPPEGSAKCSLDLRALLDSLVVQRLHPIPPIIVPQSCVYLWPTQLTQMVQIK